MTTQTTTQEHTLTTGDVLVSRWGYDQTNVDFYEVTRATPKTVLLRPIMAHREQGEAFGHYYVVPDRGQFIAGPLRYKVHLMNGEPFVMIKSFATAAKWSGATVHGTDYA